MDPNTLSVLLNLASSALYSLLCLGGKKTNQLIIGKNLPARIFVDPLLRQAISSLSEHFAWTYETGEEVTALFLCSREVEELMRQFYSIHLAHEEKSYDLTSLQTLFTTLFLQFLDQYPMDLTPKGEERKIIAATLFDALVKTCNMTLSSAADQGLLSAHEALSSYRYHIMLGQFASIQKRLDFFLARQQPLDVPAILHYEARYCKQVEERHGSITPPNFDVSREIPIDDLYVFSTLTPVSEQGEEKRQGEDPIVSIEDFLSRIQRTVVLGNPGGGKSTLTQKICHHLASKAGAHQVSGSQSLTPILVILRKYGVAKKDQRCSIREYIETEFEATYQLPPTPLHTLEYLLLNGHVLIIFDGLDELLDTGTRQEIRDDVQSFCQLYPSTPVLVTSREVGYEQAPLHYHAFEVCRLAQFDNEQVSAYVQKWFTVAKVYPSEKERQQKVENFLKESRSVSDLRSNPLMLALMCNIYRGENYIPRNRPEVYQKCADMLFERWDKGRNIHTLLPFEAHVRPAMMYLAHWIYTTDALRSGVTEPLLVEKATDYLQQKRFDDRDEAYEAARTFIFFCRDRAWVFTDTGTEKDGDRLYQFTHQTFLEYFTAIFLVRTHETPKKLLKILLVHIEKREWDVVAQLAIHQQHRQLEDAGDQLLSLLLARAKNIDTIKQWNTLDFTIRCLQFIVPSPIVVRNVTERLIFKLIEWDCERKKSGIFLITSEQAQSTFYSLLSGALENRPEIAYAIEQSLIEKIRNGEEEEQVSALVLTKFLEGHPFLAPKFLEDDPFLKVSQNVNQLYTDIKINLYPSNLRLCQLAVERREVSLKCFIAWHGFKVFFQQPGYFIFPDIHQSALSVIITDKLILGDANQDPLYFEQSCSILERVGDLVPNIPTYIYKDFNPRVYFGNHLITLKPSWLQEFQPKELKSSVLFGIFVLFAIHGEKHFFELQKSVFILKSVIIQNEFSDLHNFLLCILIYSHIKSVEERFQELLDRLKFSPEQQAIIWEWTRGEIRFIKDE